MQQCSPRRPRTPFDSCPHPLSGRTGRRSGGWAEGTHRRRPRRHRPTNTPRALPEGTRARCHAPDPTPPGPPPTTATRAACAAFRPRAVQTLPGRAHNSPGTAGSERAKGNSLRPTGTHHTLCKRRTRDSLATRVPALKRGSSRPAGRFEGARPCVLWWRLSLCRHHHRPNANAPHNRPLVCRAHSHSWPFCAQRVAAAVPEGKGATTRRSHQPRTPPSKKKQGTLPPERSHRSLAPSSLRANLPHCRFGLAGQHLRRRESVAARPFSPHRNRPTRLAAPRAKEAQGQAARMTPHTGAHHTCPPSHPPGSKCLKSSTPLPAGAGQAPPKPPPPPPGQDSLSHMHEKRAQRRAAAARAQAPILPICPNDWEDVPRRGSGTHASLKQHGKHAAASLGSKGREKRECDGGKKRHRRIWRRRPLSRENSQASRRCGGALTLARAHAWRTRAVRHGARRRACRAPRSTRSAGQGQGQGRSPLPLAHREKSA